MGPLPRPLTYQYGQELARPYGQARIDEKQASHVNENFLNAFLGNVQSSGASSNIEPLIHELEPTEPDKFMKNNDGKKSGSDDKDDYGDDFGYGGYDDDRYEVDHYDYQDNYDEDSHYDYHDKEDHYYKASINCREFHWPPATTPRKCRNVKQKDYEPDFINNRNKPDANALCRWDAGHGDEDKKAGCLCPRTKSKCYKKDQCYWYKPKGEKSKHGYGYEEDKDQKDHGECIHNSERFYNILAHLLSKRGKKDFAIKIKYSSAAAKGELPYGPWGPSIIGHREEPYRHPYGDQEYDNHADGYGNNYDYGYENYPPYGYGHDAYGAMQYIPSGYGHGRYENFDGYQGYEFPTPNYPYASNYLNVNQGYGGYANYGVPYDSQGPVGYPQNMYQNVGGYPHGVNNPQSYGSTASPVIPRGPYSDEIGQNNYIESPAYPANNIANNYISNSAYKASSVPEYQTSPLVTQLPSYEPQILPTQGYRNNLPYSVPTTGLSNYANGGGATYNPTHPLAESVAMNYGNVALLNQRHFQGPYPVLK